MAKIICVICEICGFSELRMGIARPAGESRTAKVESRTEGMTQQIKSNVALLLFEEDLQYGDIGRR